MVILRVGKDMKKLISILLLACLLSPHVSAFTSKKKGEYLGAGIILGTTNGLTAKYYLNDKKALVGTVGIYKDQVALEGTCIWHIYKFIHNQYFIPYAGPGLTLCVGGTKIERQYVGTNPGGNPRYENITVAKELLIAVRGTFGVLYKYKKWEPFIELSPFLIIIPNVNLDINLSIGGRYYFK